MKSTMSHILYSLKALEGTYIPITNKSKTKKQIRSETDLTFYILSTKLLTSLCTYRHPAGGMIGGNNSHKYICDR